MCLEKDSILISQKAGKKLPLDSTVFCTWTGRVCVVLTGCALMNVTDCEWRRVGGGRCG